MTKFKVGDRVKRKEQYLDGCWSYDCTKEDKDPRAVYEVSEVTDCGDIYLGVGGHFSWNRAKYELVTETKKTMENITKFDKKAVSDAVKDIDEERLDKQKEDAKTILRAIYSRKDTAEESKEKLSEELKDINKELGAFTKAAK